MQPLLLLSKKNFIHPRLVNSAENLAQKSALSINKGLQKENTGLPKVQVGSQENVTQDTQTEKPFSRKNSLKEVGIILLFNYKKSNLQKLHNSRKINLHRAIFQFRRKSVQLLKYPEPKQVEKSSSFRSLFTSGKEILETRRKLIVARRPKTNSQVFGNSLENVPKYSSNRIVTDITRNDNRHSFEENLPEFVVRCLKKIESMKTCDGLYRINGDTGDVQRLK